MSNIQILGKCSSLSNLQEESMDLKLMKMRAVSSSENISKLIPIVKYRAELESYRTKTMQERMDEAAPYNLFFNVLEIALETYKQPNAIKFTDLLCPSLGKLKSSLHICYYANIHWLMEQYKIKGVSDKPMVIITSDIDEEAADMYPNITYKKIVKHAQSGAHNAKISIFVYEDDSLRVTCGSVNPFYSDWLGLNQAIWVSPKCPPVTNPNSLDESETNFKTSLRTYLEQYNADILEPFIHCVDGASFRNINVFLITSYPGTCTQENPRSYSRLVSDIFLKYVDIPTTNYHDWTIIMNSPCIGYLAKRPGYHEKKSFFHYYVRLPLSSCKKSAKVLKMPQFRVMFPSIRDVIDNKMLYSRHMTILKDSRCQNWLGPKRANMLRFRMNGYGRSLTGLRAAQYYRISPCSNHLAYFLLTSANLTRSSWGILDIKHKGPNAGSFPGIVKSYEAGILFIPQFFNEKYFCIRNSTNNPDQRLFPMLVDPVMVGYSEDDEPWYIKK